MEGKSALPKTHEPKKVEGRIYALWEKSGFFNPDNLPPFAKTPGGKSKPRTENFVVMMPPPNITGSLHMGHALEATLTDCLVRLKRMQGFRTLWLPGTDHASIATQYVVEKELKKEGSTRHDLGREKFLKRVWEWRKTYGSLILEQFKRIGVSADWSRTTFTMDPAYVKAVEAAFHHYQAKGWIYKGERVVSWCTRCATSLSDLELEYKEEKGMLWYIRYPLKPTSQRESKKARKQDEQGGSLTHSLPRSSRFIVVATTRPETMLGDTAVAVHPDDGRYKDVIGKTATLPLVGEEIPVIADAAVEQTFGTGAVKVTPAHDLLDAEIGERHKLPRRKAIGEDGRLTQEVPKKYRGMKIAEARAAVIQDLKKGRFLEKEEAYTHNVAQCYRCATTIEPLPSPQWFLKMEMLAKHATRAYASGKVRIRPERFQKVALDWLSGIRDWPISRQLWWGQKIPVAGENDVFDTWFSSALWPFATLGWPSKYAQGKPRKGSDLEKYYPTQWMTSAREILHLWITRMVFSGIELAETIPFQDVWIHPTVLTSTGRRMSKSLGTGIDPLELIERYGADATRFGLLWHATGLQDIRFDETAMVSGKKFCNKLWNATRFVLHYSQGAMLPDAPPKSTHKEDREILKQFEQTRQTLEGHIAEFRFGQALEVLYAFFWHTFCDRFIERVKQRSDKEARQTLLWVLGASMKLLHPFLPFITEELWENIPKKQKGLLMVEHWPRTK